MSQIGNVSAEQLTTIIQRVERLEEEKSSIQEDIKEVFAEAKSAGFDVKILKQIVKLRKMDQADRQEMELLLETYKRALNLK